MIELSCDLGEADTREGIAVERAIWPLIDAGNVACGGHAGDEGSMGEAIRLAGAHGVIVGAHPSYPDRENFGRVSMDIGHDALVESLVQQISRLPARRVKAHGALYNDAHAGAARAAAIVEAVQRAGSPAVVAGDTSQTAAVARARGVAVIREAFADRRYNEDGSLVSRREPGALLSIAEAAEQAKLLAAEGVVIARGGRRVPIAFETLCIHADMEGAVERLRAIRAALGR
ncbi:MAG TPA: LamB/YcsF family protein [Thermoanaerobaculia bacterium]|nr:LamB/YcsF family protein [Thermoanaerobaculia bacterium]